MSNTNKTLMEAIQWYMENVYDCTWTEADALDTVDDYDNRLTIADDNEYATIPSHCGILPLLDAVRHIRYTGIVYVLYGRYVEEYDGALYQTIYYLFENGLPIAHLEENRWDGEEDAPGVDWATHVISGFDKGGISGGEESLKKLQDMVSARKERYQKEMEDWKSQYAMTDEEFKHIETAKEMVWDAVNLDRSGYPDLFEAVKNADTEAKRLGIQREFRAAMMVGRFDEFPIAEYESVMTPQWYRPKAINVNWTLKEDDVNTQCPIEDIPIWIIRFKDGDIDNGYAWNQTALNHIRFGDISYRPY